MITYCIFFCFDAKKSDFPNLKSTFREKFDFNQIQPINKIFVGSSYYMDNKMFEWSNEVFGCFEEIGIFGRFNQKICFNQPKFVGFNQIFMDIQQNNFAASRKVFFCVYPQKNLFINFLCVDSSKLKIVKSSQLSL